MLDLFLVLFSALLALGPEGFFIGLLGIGICFYGIVRIVDHIVFITWERLRYRRARMRFLSAVERGERPERCPHMIRYNGTIEWEPRLHFMSALGQRQLKAVGEIRTLRP